MEMARKFQLDKVAEHTKNLQDAYTSMKKAKKDAENASAVALDASNSLLKAQRTRQAKEKELDKLNSKAVSTKEKADHLNDTLSVTEDIYQTAQSEYNAYQLPALCEDMRQKEEERSIQTRRVLLDITIFEKSLTDVRVECIADSITKISDIDVVDDTERFSDIFTSDDASEERFPQSFDNGAKSGALHVKRGDVVPGWKKRIFILASETRTLYSFEDPTASKPRDVIPLDECQVHSLDESYFGRPYSFQIARAKSPIAPKQLYNFAAASEDEREDWISVLRLYTFCCFKCVRVFGGPSMTSAMFAVAQAARGSDQSLASHEEGVNLALVGGRSQSLGSISNLRSLHSKISSPVARLPTDYREVRSLSVSVAEAKDLPAPTLSGGRSAGGVNPYCVILLDDIKQARTTSKSGDSPFWSESFQLDDIAPHHTRLQVLVFSQNKSSRDFEIGYVSIGINGLKPGKQYEEWIPIRPFHRSSMTSSPSSLAASWNVGANGSLVGIATINSPGTSTPVVDGRYGSIRISYCLNEQNLLPMSQYEPFMEIVTYPTLSAIKLFGMSAQSREYSSVVLNILLARGMEMQGVKTLLDSEIKSADANTIFRGNTLATKVVDRYMKLFLDYLRKTLHPVLSIVFDSRESLEVDPTRIITSAGTNVHETVALNRQRLLDYLELLWDAIRNSTPYFPKELSELCRHIVKQVEQRFRTADGGIDHFVKYSAVTGFIFLRFICPAILSPKLFSLHDELPDPTVSRTLTLLAKTIQNLANLTEFGAKEPYMTEFNTFIVKHMPDMRHFLRTIANPREVGSLASPPQKTRIDIRREMENLFQLFKASLPEPGVNPQADSVLVGLMPVLNQLDLAHQAYEEQSAALLNVFESQGFKKGSQFGSITSIDSHSPRAAVTPPRLSSALPEYTEGRGSRADGNRHRHKAFINEVSPTDNLEAVAATILGASLSYNESSYSSLTNLATSESSNEMNAQVAMSQSYSSSSPMRRNADGTDSSDRSMSSRTGFYDDISEVESFSGEIFGDSKNNSSTYSERKMRPAGVHQAKSGLHLGSVGSKLRAMMTSGSANTSGNSLPIDTPGRESRSANGEWNGSPGGLGVSPSGKKSHDASSIKSFQSVRSEGSVGNAVHLPQNPDQAWGDPNRDERPREPPSPGLLKPRKKRLSLFGKTKE
ncbi:hypothetical protein BJ742DRAFT_806797 [Cladochytrium replicatum]|nr:hypothetical protein BJ742DRAFT_806797 [Cladochytrium replicatum]